MKTGQLFVRTALALMLVGAAVAPKDASAQSQLDVAQARNFLGTWDLALTSDMGSFTMNLEVTDMGGKVAASVGAPEMGGMQEVKDISKDGEILVLSYNGDFQGQTFEAVITLEPDGDKLTVWFDINQGTFGMGGSGTKRAS